MISEQVGSLERENGKLRKTVDSLQALLDTDHIKPRHCESCKNFIRHYIYNSHMGYTETFDGHCVHGRKTGRSRHIEDSCKDFEFGRYE